MTHYEFKGVLMKALIAGPVVCEHYFVNTGFAQDHSK